MRRNGRVCRMLSRPVESGDVIDLERAAVDPAALRPLPPALPILHEDPWLTAVDKPAGVLAQPAGMRAPGELAADELVLLQLAVRDGCPPYLRLLHRLDRVTSGLLLFARRPEVLAPLVRAWRDGAAERDYLALVEGEPRFARRRIEAPIGRSAEAAWRFEVAVGGRPASTEVEVLELLPGAALVRCRLLSGRTHQVRVHLAHAGLPVAGDQLYGALRLAPPRPLLHAARLALPHPATGERLEVASPPPEDFARFVEGLRGAPPSPRSGARV